jgi:two-component system copper resistance phosphate regulon response regulator CusR
MKILIIEDEEKIARFLKQILENDKNTVTMCASIEEVFKKQYERSHDLIVLDLMLAGKPGIELLKQLKKQKIDIPVLVLSALNQISTKVELFNAGADDYMTKPFAAEELVARIKNIYRRHLEVEKKDEIQFGDKTFSRKENKVTSGDKIIHLTAKEAELLLFLLQNKGKTVRNEDIIKRIWNSTASFHSNIIQATVRRLRKKIDNNPEQKFIKNVHGLGYSITTE